MLDLDKMKLRLKFQYKVMQRFMNGSSKI